MFRGGKVGVFNAFRGGQKRPITIIARTPTISGKIGAKPFVKKIQGNSEAFPLVSLVKSLTVPA